MSFLRSGIGGGSGGMPPEMASNLMQAEQEMDMMGDLYHRLAQVCHTKCIGKPYLDDHLTKGESVCTDRCVSKFFDVSYMVGKKLAAHGQQAQQRMQQQQ